MSTEPWRWTILILLLAGLSSGCAVTGAASRPLVITSGSQLADLYWRGELTDTHGNRWNVWILPGIAPTLEDAAESFDDAADFAIEPFHGEFWEDRAEEFGDGLEFAFQDVLMEFLVRGVRSDWTDATAAIAANLDQAPFGWIPRILGNALWGYLVMPLGRLALAPVGMVGGVTYTLAAPSLQLVARPAGGVTWTALAGVAVPTLLLGYHQPCWLLCITNREPDESLDGSFGLEIIRPEGESPLAAEPLEKPEPPSTGLVPFAPPPVRRPEDQAPPAHEPSYDTDPSYRFGYDRGFKAGVREGERRAATGEAPATEPEASPQAPDAPSTAPEASPTVPD
jgi:hypothetical protein